MTTILITLTAIAAYLGVGVTIYTVVTTHSHADKATSWLILTWPLVLLRALWELRK